LNSLQLKTKKQSEFETLLSSNLSISDIPSDNYPLTQIFEQKINSMMSDMVDSILAQNRNENPQVILQTITSKIPSTVLLRYARAGKNYVSIDHTMGDLGNLFFRSMFDRIMMNQPCEHHTATQQNKISFIFRQ